MANSNALHHFIFHVSNLAPRQIIIIHLKEKISPKIFIILTFLMHFSQLPCFSNSGRGDRQRLPMNGTYWDMRMKRYCMHRIHPLSVKTAMLACEADTSFIDTYLVQVVPFCTSNQDWVASVCLFLAHRTVRHYSCLDFCVAKKKL